MIADSRRHGRITTFFTDRIGGVSKGAYASFNLGLFSGDDRTKVMHNRSLLCGVLNIKPTHLVVPNEVHGSKVMVVEEPDLLISSEQRDEYFKCDALVTRMTQVCLGVTVADCVPVLFFDEPTGVVAAAHAGWKGIVSGVLPETVTAMRRMGCLSENIHAEIWPSISCAHFEVGEEVVVRFAECFSGSEMRGIVDYGYPKPHLNLREAVRLQLAQAHLSSDHIWSHPDCTYGSSRYFSARRDGFASGRMVAGVFVG